MPFADRSIDLTGKMLQPIMLGHATDDVRLALEEVVFATEAVAALTRSVVAALAPLAEDSAELWTGPLTSGQDTPLSPRECEVLTLVAEGQTNKAIAEALYISPNTVKTHVSSLLNKLQADSRAQLAAIATRHGLHQLSTTASGTPCAITSSRPRG